MNGKQILFLLTFWAGLGLAQEAWAQSAEATPMPIPKAPWLAPIPDNAHWTISITYTAPGIMANSPQNKVPASQAGFSVSLDVIKTGSLKQVTVSLAGGGVQQFDQRGVYFAVRAPEGLRLVSPSNLFPPYRYYSPGFHFVDWVQESAFKDVAKYKTILCFHYAEVIENEPGQGGSVRPADPNNIKEAWIDVGSMAPVAYKEHALTAEFSFQQPPASPLSFPPDELAQFEKREATDKAFQSIR